MQVFQTLKPMLIHMTYILASLFNLIEKTNSCLQYEFKPCSSKLYVHIAFCCFEL